MGNWTDVVFCVQGFNTGILWLRPTEPTIKLMATWRDALLTTTDKFEHDQDIFNKLLRNEDDGSPARFTSVEGSDGVRMTKSTFAEADGDGAVGERLHMTRAARGITLGALPLSRFCSGQVYFVQRLPERLGVKPLVVHTTYQFSQARGKRQRLREAGLWLLDDDSYRGVGPHFKKKGFIAMLPTDQPPLSVIGGAGVENHLAAAAWYRLVIRNLIAIGEATDRVPIIPRIVCTCDRWWGNVLPSCKIPGSDVPPPFTTCPQDHIMNLPNMERAGVDWREWSFPDRLPEGENNTAVLVKLAPGGESPGAEGGADTDTAVRVTRTIELPAYPTDQEWVRAIGDATEKVAYVSSAVDSFCTFSDAAASAAFDAKMSVALQAESHFCELIEGARDGPKRACHVGFDTPRGVSKDNDCVAMRRKAGSEDAFRLRFDRRHPLGGEKRPPA